MSVAQSARPASHERHALKHVSIHLLIPLFLGVGMALAYLGAFHQPSPHDVRIDVVGSSAETKVMAQTLQDKLGDAVSVRTVADEATAKAAIEHRDISAALVPDAKKPVLLYSDAASATTSQVIVTIFSEVATGQGVPLELDNVVPVASDGDPSGQSMFFYLVGMTVGSYAAGVAIGAAGTALRHRWRVGLAVVSSGVTTLLVTVIASAVYGALPSHAVQIGLLAWLYSATIMLIGVGLHSFLGKVTTPTMTMLFVMLNFTSAGGVYEPDLLPRFFGALHSFWNGAALHEVGRDLMYFPQVGIGRYVLTLALWFVAACALVLASFLYERKRHVPLHQGSAEDEELEEVVAAA